MGYSLRQFWGSPGKRGRFSGIKRASHANCLQNLLSVFSSRVLIILDRTFTPNHSSILAAYLVLHFKMKMKNKNKDGEHLLLPLSGGSMSVKSDDFDLNIPQNSEDLNEAHCGQAYLSSVQLMANWKVFVFLFCVTHATVDSVLAFSTAELGFVAGSDGSACLYLFYTFSAFFLAKPVLRQFGAKHSVLIGLVGMLIYVMSFFIALMADTSEAGKSAIFMIGASLGGIGT